VALRELFKRRALQLRQACLWQRTRRQTAGVFAQRNPAVKGRATDAEHNVCRHLAHALINRF